MVSSWLLPPQFAHLPAGFIAVGVGVVGYAKHVFEYRSTHCAAIVHYQTIFKIGFCCRLWRVKSVACYL